MLGVRSQSLGCILPLYLRVSPSAKLDFAPHEVLESTLKSLMAVLCMFPLTYGWGTRWCIVDALGAIWHSLVAVWKGGHIVHTRVIQDGVHSRFWWWKMMPFHDAGDAT